MNGRHPKTRAKTWRSTPRLAVMLTMLSALFSALLAGAARPAVETGLIAFTREDGVYVMRADGSGVRAVWPGGHVVTDVAWSPDGMKLAFGKTGAMMVMNADGSGLVRIVGRTARSLTWSPDGRRIAFTSARWGKAPDIWLVNADGSGLQRLTRTPKLGETNVDWRPTGGRLAFDSGSWVPSVYVMKTDGTNRRNLTPVRKWRGWSEQPDWTPDGRRIAFTHAKPFGSQTALGPENCDIWVMSASSKGKVRLTDNRVYDGFPAWSPDGRRIAFVRSAKPAESEIYVMNADGSGVTKLTHGGENGSPAWQPVAP